jgi:hypothetical protein
VNESFAMLYSLDLPLWWLQAAGPASDVSLNNVWWSEPSASGREEPSRTCLVGMNRPAYSRCVLYEIKRALSCAVGLEAVWAVDCVSNRVSCAGFQGGWVVVDSVAG